MKSQKERSLDKEILSALDGPALKAAQMLLKDKEVQCLQEYANVVAIQRLGYNDHGPVHMRTVALNALTLADLLHKAHVPLTFEREKTGTISDSKVVLVIAGLLHDVGMTVGRDCHEETASMLVLPIIDRVMSAVYSAEPEKRIIARSLILESILGHMATRHVHSMEAGILLIADGCDMEKGRARIPMMLTTASRVGDIHKYSASSIHSVRIGKGEKKPIRIAVEMKDSVGFFQIEEVLFPKINASTIRDFIEVYAGVTGKPLKCYL